MVTTNVAPKRVGKLVDRREGRWMGMDQRRQPGRKRGKGQLERNHPVWIVTHRLHLLVEVDGSMRLG